MTDGTAPQGAPESIVVEVPIAATSAISLPEIEFVDPEAIRKRDENFRISAEFIRERLVKFSQQHGVGIVAVLVQSSGSGEVASIMGAPEDASFTVAQTVARVPFVLGDLVGRTISGELPETRIQVGVAMIQAFSEGIQKGVTHT